MLVDLDLDAAAWSEVAGEDEVVAGELADSFGTALGGTVPDGSAGDFGAGVGPLDDGVLADS